MEDFKQEPAGDPEVEESSEPPELQKSRKERGKSGNPELSHQLSLWSANSSEPGADSSGQPTGESDASGIPPSGPQLIPPAIKDPPWSLEDLIAFILFAFLSFVFANVAVVFVISILRQRFALHTSIEQAFSKTPWVVAMQTAWELMWLGFIYVIVSKKYHRRFWEALKWVKTPHSAGLFLIAGAAVAFLAQLIVNLFPSQKHLPIEKLFSSPESAYLLAFFGIFVAPFVEELVFRGFFYPVFERMWGFTAAVLLTALLFAGIHIPQLSGGWQEIASIFVVGAVFSYCRGKTGSLIPSFLMHLSYNTVLFVSLYVSTDHFRNLKG
jgi:membrane protease YdiL (CAAX protease family)